MMQPRCTKDFFNIKVMPRAHRTDTQHGDSERQGFDFADRLLAVQRQGDFHEVVEFLTSVQEVKCDYD